MRVFSVGSMVMAAFFFFASPASAAEGKRGSCDCGACAEAKGCGCAEKGKECSCPAGKCTCGAEKKSCDGACDCGKGCDGSCGHGKGGKNKT